MSTWTIGRGIVLRAIALVVLASCSDPGPTPAPAVSPSSVVLSPSSVTFKSIGEAARITATVKGSDGSTISSPVSWSTADPGVATVGSDGTVTATGNGTTVVTATSGLASATSSVKVQQEPSEIVVSPQAVVLSAPAATASVTATVRDSKGTAIPGASLTWTSSDPTVATVAAGIVTAVANGVATIAVESGSKTATVSVTVAFTGGATPIYRWTFSEEGGPNAVFLDLMRGVPARVIRVGGPAASAVGGQVTLSGGAKGNADYIALPGGILRNLTDAAIEVWATLHSRKTWSRVFDVGSSPANNLFVAWSQDRNPNADRVGFAVNGVENRLDNRLGPINVDLQHHIVLSIDDGAGANGTTRISLHVDGQSRGSFDAPYKLRDLIDDDFWLGRSHYEDETANASYDEISIHDRVYDDAQVADLFRRGPIRSGVTATIAIAPPAGMRDTIRGVGVRFPLKLVGKDILGRQFQISGAQWSSSNPVVATVDGDGIVSALTEGRAEIVAMVQGKTARWNADAIRMQHVSIDSYLATPIQGAQWEVPVVLIEYLPTADGFSLDTLRAPDFYWSNPISLDSMEAQVLSYAKRRKMMVEEGSRFRGYADATARPSLGYRVVDHIIVYDQIPPHPTKRNTGAQGQPRFEGWHTVFAELELKPLMESKKVRELWVAWSAFDGGTPSYNPSAQRVEDMRVPWESNMSSPTTGDISNSDRDPNDTPVLGHTYIIYYINVRRSQAEAVHNVGHQLEAMLSYVATRQDGHDRLFWQDFVGQNVQRQFITGRAGWTHMPPNTTENYDYLNPTLVAAEIEDWRPDHSGQKKPVNVDTWGKLNYPWPGAADFGQRIESQWYTYWFQNIPGRDNRIPHPGGWMTNWWAFVADWDAAVRSGLGLHSPTPAATVGSGQAYGYRFPSAPIPIRE